jgi:polyisoprenoid-binding protein YceI
MSAPADPGPTPQKRKALPFVIGGVVVLAVLVGAGLWWFLGRDNPDEVDLDTAAAGVESTTTTAADGGATTTAPPAEGDLSGTWIVDTSTGEFDFESATGTFAGFRIDEELVSIGATEAVGRTGDVTGSFVIDGTTVTEADFEVTLTTVTTDESRRDDRVQQALDTGQFPTTTFTLTEPIELGPDAATGADVSVTATGELTLKGVTNPVEIPLQARLVDGTVVVVGSVDIAFSDYGVEVPSAPVVVSVADVGTIEVQLLLRRS